MEERRVEECPRQRTNAYPEKQHHGELEAPGVGSEVQLKLERQTEFAFSMGLSSSLKAPQDF